MGVFQECGVQSGWKCADLSLKLTILKKRNLKGVTIHLHAVIIHI
jgi:hypothetical protein